MREEEMMAVVDYVETPGILREIARKIVARESDDRFLELAKGLEERPRQQ